MINTAPARNGTQGRVSPEDDHPEKPRFGWLLTAAQYIVLAAGCTGGWLILTRDVPQARPVRKQHLEFSPAAVWEDQFGPSMDLSPGGDMLVYHGRGPSGSHLFLRPIDQQNAIVLPGTAGATYPAFSPDGRWIGFQRSGQVLRIPAAGGQPGVVCSSLTGPLSTYAWLTDRSVVIADERGLTRCTMNGTIASLYSAPDSTDHLAWPHALPANRGILYTEARRAAHQLGVYDSRSRTARSLGVTGSNPRYLAGGYLTYASEDGVIRAVPFDLEDLVVYGEPVVIMQGVRVGRGGAAKMAISRNGVMVAPDSGILP